MGNKDKTGNERQQRRRKREKEWLKEHGFESWEALHPALMNGETSLTPRVPDMWESTPLQAFSHPETLATSQALSTPPTCG